MIFHYNNRLHEGHVNVTSIRTLVVLLAIGWDKIYGIEHIWCLDILIMLANNWMDVWVATACGIISLFRRLAGRFVCIFRVTYIRQSRCWNDRWDIISVTQQRRKTNSVTPWTWRHHIPPKHLNRLAFHNV